MKQIKDAQALTDLVREQLEACFDSATLGVAASSLGYLYIVQLGGSKPRYFEIIVREKQ